MMAQGSTIVGQGMQNKGVPDSKKDNPGKNTTGDAHQVISMNDDPMKGSEESEGPVQGGLLEASRRLQDTTFGGSQ